MQKGSPVRLLFSLFLILNALVISFREKLEGIGFDVYMLLIGHVILFVMTLISMTLLIRSLKAASSAAFLRGVYGSFILKFFMVAITVLVYAFLNREKVNKPGIFTLMFLYLVYTFLEVRALLKISEKPGGHVQK